MNGHSALILWGVMLALLGPVSAAHAYIDPGTGSYLLQLLIGSAMAGGVLLKMYWQNVKSWFTRQKPEAADEADDD